MIYKGLLSVLAATIACAARANELSFGEYVKAFGKTYAPGSGEWLKHEKQFHEQIQHIREHNRAFEAGKVTYTLGVNKFTDLDAQEMQSFMGYSGVQASLRHGKFASGVHTPGTVKDVAESLNWVEKGAVTPVRDQGSCGSCWAQASTAEMESFLAIKTGFLTDLSAQQLVDCAPNDDHCGGTGGCRGSTAPLAFDYLLEAGGMAIEWAYPYVDYWYNKAPRRHACKYDNSIAVSENVVGAVLDGYVLVQNNSYDAMLEAVNVGPVAINVAASAWKSYTGGVFDGCSYDDIIINHVVQLVGYGTDDATGLDYWLVKNSWGPYWGEKGYIRLRRQNPYKGESVPCGKDTSPQSGTECQGGDKVIEVCGTCGMYWHGAYPTSVSPAYA